MSSGEASSIRSLDGAGHEVYTRRRRVSHAGGHEVPRRRSRVTHPGGGQEIRTPPPGTCDRRRRRRRDPRAAGGEELPWRRLASSFRSGRTLRQGTPAPPGDRAGQAAEDACGCISFDSLCTLALVLFAVLVCCLVLVHVSLALVHAILGFLWALRNLVFLAFRLTCATVCLLALSRICYLVVWTSFIYLVGSVVLAASFTYAVLALFSRFISVVLIPINQMSNWRRAAMFHFNILAETIDVFFASEDFDVTCMLFGSEFSKLELQEWPEDATATAVPVDYRVKVDDFTKLHSDLRASLPCVASVRVDHNVKVGNHHKFHIEPPRSSSAADLLEGTPVLPEQRKGDLPNGYIHVNLVGEGLFDRTTIALREDNLYIVAFMNHLGRWFVFRGSKHEFPAATVRVSSLPFTGSYRHLVAGGYKSLPGLDMGRQAALDAVRRLAWHRCYEHAAEIFSNSESQKAKDLLTAYNGDDYNNELKTAMARICVLVAEAARFKGIHDTLRDGWKQGIDSKITISEGDANMVVLWRSISLTSLRWAEFQRLKWCRDAKKREIHLEGPEKHFAGLNLLLWPHGFEFRRDRSSQMICCRPGRAMARAYCWG